MESAPSFVCSRSVGYNGPFFQQFCSTPDPVTSDSANTKNPAWPKRQVVTYFNEVPKGWGQG